MVSTTPPTADVESVLARFAGPDSPTVVFDTDIGHDLDDTLALAVLARTVANLIVVTNDEPMHPRRRPRAGYARMLLDAMGRREVIVVAGHQLHNSEDRFLVDALGPFEHPLYTDIAGALTHVCENAIEPVVWIGAGPVTNLATLATVAPHVLDIIEVTMQGGWLDHYRRPDRASHNPRTDPASYGLVMRALDKPRLMLSTHTNTDAFAITPTSPLIKALSAPEAPGWAAPIAAHADAWFTQRPSSWMSDPATVAAALGLPVAEFATERVRIAADARLTRDPYGRTVEVSTHVHGTAVMDWITTTLALPTT